MENQTTYVQRLSDDILCFILLIFAFGCLVQVFVSLYKELIGTGLFSTAGFTGAVLLYMKWNVVRRTKIKQSSVGEIGELLKESKSVSNGE